MTESAESPLRDYLCTGKNGTETVKNLDFGESPVPVWTKEKRALFASRLRSAYVTILMLSHAALQMPSFTGRRLSHVTPCVRLSA